MKRNFIIISVLFALVSGYGQINSKNPMLLIRLDDVGMNHSTNMAAEKIFQTGIPINASVMVACPWFMEAVDIIKKYENVSVGIHITLNSEWKYYKWRPILGSAQVPSLVDENGFFHSENMWFWKDSVDLIEVEKELRAQINFALKMGLKVDYLDNHMSCMKQSDEMINLFMKLAKEYNVGISGFFAEKRHGVKETEYNESKLALKEYIKSLNKSETHLLVLHPGLDNPEMDGMVLADSKTSDYNNIRKGRAAGTKALISKEVIDLITDLNINVLSYKDYIQSVGINTMKKYQ